MARGKIDCKVFACVLFFATLGSPKVAAGADIMSVECDLVIAGKIEAGDDKRFEASLAGLYRSKCEAPKIYLYSPGGDLREAIGIGRQISALYLTTVAPSLGSSDADSKPRNGSRVCKMLPGSAERAKRESVIFQRETQAFFNALKYNKPAPRRTKFLGDFDPESGQGDSRCTCASACFFIWAAGTDRQGDVLLIHRPYFDPATFAKLDAADAKAAYQKLSDEARSFLSEVGIQPTITERMFNTGSDQASYLSAEELRSLRMPAYLSELRLAKCGPEPQLEDYVKVTDLSKCNYPLAKLSTGSSDNVLTSQDRCTLVNRYRWRLCWAHSLNVFRQKAVAAYINGAP